MPLLHTSICQTMDDALNEVEPIYCHHNHPNDSSSLFTLTKTMYQNSLKQDGRRLRCPATVCQKALLIRKDAFFESSTLFLEQALTMIWSWANGEMPVLRVPTAAWTGITFAGRLAGVRCKTTRPSHALMARPRLVGLARSSKSTSQNSEKESTTAAAVLKGNGRLDSFRGIERGNRRNIFMVPVKKRDAETLIYVIWRKIAPGTTIYSDMWKGYVTPWLNALGFHHETVNHSQNFVDPITGVHTRNIESNWPAVKMWMPRNGTSKTMFESYLYEFM